MNRHRVFGALTLALLVAGVALPATKAASQQATTTPKEQIIGAWTLVSIQGERQDGSRFNQYGPNPKGVVILERNGHFAAMVTQADLPKIAANDRLKTTPEENKAIMQGLIAMFGKYSVDERDQTLVLHIESSTFPNFNGTDQKRRLAVLTGDDMTWVSSAPPTANSVSVYVVWKRARQ